MSSKTLYKVSCRHVHKDFCFTDTVVTVYHCSDGYYAQHDPLGCSKTYATAEKAARSMFQDNACHSITCEQISFVSWE